MAVASIRKPATTVSLLSARTNFGKLLDQLEEDGRSLVIEKRGTPRAVLMSLQDYVRLAAPEPEILRIIGEESVRNGTDDLSDDEIDRIIRKTRASRKKS